MWQIRLDWKRNNPHSIFVSFFSTFRSSFWFFDPGIQNSRNPGIPWICLFFAKFNRYGVFPTHILSRNLIFNVAIQNSITPGSFLEFTGTLEFPWKWQIFGQIWLIGYQFILIFVTKLEFEPKIEKIQFLGTPDNFWDQKSKNYSGCQEKNIFFNFGVKSKFIDKN